MQMTLPDGQRKVTLEAARSSRRGSGLCAQWAGRKECTAARSRQARAQGAQLRVDPWVTSPRTRRGWYSGPEGQHAPRRPAGAPAHVLDQGDVRCAEAELREVHVPPHLPAP
jgi:hypothetical protein